MRDAAVELGVPFVGHGRKRMVVTAAFVAALEARETTTQPAEVADPADALRQKLGLRLVGGFHG